MNVVAAMYERWARGESGDGDSWGDITTEPGGVDYLEVDAGGVPAMWVEPHGAARDRVIVYCTAAASSAARSTPIASSSPTWRRRPVSGRCWCTTG